MCSNGHEVIIKDIPIFRMMDVKILILLKEMTVFFVVVVSTMVTGTYVALTASGTFRISGTTSLVFVSCCPHFNSVL